ncbi:MAG: TldD/PmbA family protein [Oscillospiraceae bacterium]|nr:TldD/PmbA family protein [Oscillospiraceae bacterium]
MNNMDLIRNTVAETAKQFGAEGYELTISSKEETGVEALKKEVSTVSYARSGSMVVRCVVGGKSGYAASELVTPEAAALIVETACDNARVLDEADQVGLFPGSDHYETSRDACVDLPDTDALRERALNMQELAYAADPKVVDGTLTVVTGMNVVQDVMNSAGLQLHYETGLVFQGVQAAVKDGEDASDDFCLTELGKKTAEETVQKAVSGALSKLGADTVPSGKYDVIMDSATICSLMKRYADVFSARSAYLKTTLLAGCEGQMVGSERLTLIDDPFYPEKFGHCPFDGEGVAVYTKKVIENGVLNTLLYNRMYAKLLGKQTTGNASSATSIEPKGLYIAPGTLSNEELLRKLGDGLYLTSLQGLHAGANVQSGDFSLQADGFLVKDGVKASPIKNFTVAGNFFQLLKQVADVSSEVKFGVGSDFGAPDVLFNGLAISGK